MRTVDKIGGILIAVFIVAAFGAAALSGAASFAKSSINQATIANESNTSTNTQNTQANVTSNEEATTNEPEDDTSVGTLSVTYLDVGQGDSTLIECDGHWMLIDGGVSDVSDKIYSVLKEKGVSQLDCIVATHPDADHIGGISGALNYAKTNVLYCSTDTSDTKTFQSMVKYLQSSSGIGITIPSAGDTFKLGSATIQFLGPVGSYPDDNNNSLIVRIDLGSTSFLFTGDAEEEAEHALVSAGANIDVDVLHVGHHGSSTSSTKEFLESVTPEYAIISVGENTYGHPTNAALSRIEAVKATILRTDQLGDITFVSDGKTLSYSTSK